MVYLKYVENVIPLSKLIGLLFLFCLPLLSILFLKTKRNDLARPVMGTIFLVTSGKEVTRMNQMKTASYATRLIRHKTSGHGIAECATTLSFLVLDHEAW